jgi:hypothetical protein
MTQRFCEVCNDPLPLESEESMCESCLDAVEVEVGLMSEAIDAEEKKWETPAQSAEASSSSATPDETSIAHKSTSGSFDALDAVSDMDSGNLDSPTPSSEASPSPTPTEKEKKTEPCEACGTLQETLKPFKHQHVKEQMLLCDTCHATETALVAHANDPMQGKVVHPDEAAREELMTMDDADRILYNEEVMLSVESPIEMVYNRIALLEGRLQRAKLLLKASKTTLFMRIEHMKKDEREAEYRRLNERDATKRRRTAATSAPGVPGEKKKAAPRKTKAAAFRALMSAQGLPDEWIEEQIKKAGLE